MKLYGLVFALLLVVAIIPSVEGQRSTQKMLEDLEREGFEDCEVLQIQEAFYQPIRINLVHEDVKKHDISIQSEDKASEVFYEGTRETFQLVTKSLGVHTVQIILNYEESKRNEPRQVYYQIYTQNNILTQEGNWVAEGDRFCKVIEFNVTDAPHILTQDEIQEQYNKFNSDFRKESSIKQTSIENGILIVGVGQALTVIFVVVMFFVIVVTLKAVGRVSKRPVKKVEELIEELRKVGKNLGIAGEQSVTTYETLKSEFEQDQKDFKKILMREVQSGFKDIVYYLWGNAKKKDGKSFPDPKSLVFTEPTESAKSTTTPVESESKKELTKKEKFEKHSGYAKKADEKRPDEPKVEGNTPEEERENEESFEKDYGVKEPPHETTFVPEDFEEEPETKNSEEKPDLLYQNIPDIETDRILEQDSDVHLDNIKEEQDMASIEVEEQDVPLDAMCYSCGEEPEFYCERCRNVFCVKHNEHKCEIKYDIPTKIVKDMSKVINKTFGGNKKPTILDENEVDKALHSGKTKEQVVQLIVDEYMKIPYQEAYDLYNEMQKEFANNKTVPKAILINALSKRLLRSTR